MCDAYGILGKMPPVGGGVLIEFLKISKFRFILPPRFRSGEDRTRDHLLGVRRKLFGNAENQLWRPNIMAGYRYFSKLVYY